MAYLGSDQQSLTFNFSRPACFVIAQVRHSHQTLHSWRVTLWACVFLSYSSLIRRSGMKGLLDTADLICPHILVFSFRRGGIHLGGQLCERLLLRSLVYGVTG